MDVASWLTDVHGPRLSGSPSIQKAGEWAVAKMKEWGLENVRARAVAGRCKRRQQRLPARLDERQVLSGRRLTAGVSDSGHADGLDAGHERPRSRRGRAGDRDDRRGAQDEVRRRQAARQVGDHVPGAGCAGLLERAGEPAHAAKTWPAWTAPTCRRRSATQPAAPGPAAAADAGGPAADAAAGARAAAAAVQPQRVLPDRRRARHLLDRAARPWHLHDRRRHRAPPIRRRCCRRSRFRPSSTAAWPA